MNVGSLVHRALPWVMLLWAGTAWWTVHVTTSVWVPACVLVACVVTLALHGPGRPGVRVLTLLTGWLVLAAWVGVTLTVLQDDTGDVIWILPTWAPASGSEVGGPVTTGRLLIGGEMSLRALTHVGLLGVLLTVVPGPGWSRVADLLLGGAARWVRPLCFLGDAVEHVHSERTERRRNGDGRLDSGGTVAAVVVHALTEAERWGDSDPVDRASLIERLHAVTLLLLGLLFTWLAVERRLAPASATLLLVGAGGAAGLLLLHGPFKRHLHRQGRETAPPDVTPVGAMAGAALVLLSAALVAGLVLVESDQAWPAMATLLLPLAFIVAPLVGPRTASEVTS